MEEQLLTTIYSPSMAKLSQHGRPATWPPATGPDVHALPMSRKDFGMDIRGKSYASGQGQKMTSRFRICFFRYF